jgi:hypothetical protein
MKASERGMLPRQNAVDICCPKCRSRATLVWEISGKDKTLVRLTGHFYERLSATPPHPIELVCLKCGTPQTEER